MRLEVGRGPGGNEKQPGDPVRWWNGVQPGRPADSTTTRPRFDRQPRRPDSRATGRRRRAPGRTGGDHDRARERWAGGSCIRIRFPPVPRSPGWPEALPGARSRARTPRVSSVARRRYHHRPRPATIMGKLEDRPRIRARPPRGHLSAIPTTLKAKGPIHETQGVPSANVDAWGRRARRAGAGRR